MKQENSDIPVDFIETLKRTEQNPLTSVISSVMKSEKKGSREKNVEWSPWETFEVAKENITVENATFKKKFIINSLPHPLKSNVIMSSMTLQKPGRNLREKKCAIICRSGETENKPFHHFNIKAESLVDWICSSSDARLELEHFRWTQNQSVL